MDEQLFVQWLCAGPICSFQPKWDMSLVGMIIDMTMLSVRILLPQRFDTAGLDPQTQAQEIEGVFRAEVEQTVVTSVSSLWTAGCSGLRCLFWWISDESANKSLCHEKLLWSFRDKKKKSFHCVWIILKHFQSLLKTVWTGKIKNTKSDYIFSTISQSLCSCKMWSWGKHFNYPEK